MEPGFSSFTLIVPSDLHREIKLQAESEDKSMKEWVIVACRLLLRISDKSRRDLNNQHLPAGVVAVSPTSPPAAR